MKRQHKRLTLDRETIRTMAVPELAAVVGGATALCPSPPTGSAQCVSVGCTRVDCEPTPTASCDTKL